jgi:2,4-dienoyl-CoA reductase-like NADH-dependent reductase (Old Yellow Enzyme family)
VIEAFSVTPAGALKVPLIAVQEYPILFSPLVVGPLTLRNRIVNAAHQTGFARSGAYTEQLIEYHRERARGGAALIVSQATSVTGEYLDLYNADDSVVPSYQAVSDAVREHGSHYAAELYHPGSQGEYTGRGAERFVAPSSLPASYLGGRWRVAHALDESEILGIVNAFGTAAARCRAGGLSGIELHFAHGNLVEQFMSPKTNRRTDDWGGDLEGRLRFAQMIVTAVRSAAGRDIAVGARVTATGLDRDDLDDYDMAEIIGTLGSWGELDYMSVTMGHYSDALNTARNVPNMTFEPGLWRRYGKLIRSVVDIPVFMVGRINHPRTAEDLLEAGVCDAVVMARALIADPHLPNKARTGRTIDIRPCVGAMNCLNSVEHGRGIRCIHNPRVGHELELTEEVERAEGGQRVIVIGGGPAGLEAARVAAVRGHTVQLFERSAKVGGQVRQAAAAPGRSELGTIIEWLEQQCVAEGVTITTGRDVTLDQLMEEDADLFVIASGASHPGMPTPGREMSEETINLIQSHVSLASLADALRGAVSGTTVAVYDAGADWPGFNAARVLAQRGLKVHYITPEPHPGVALEVTNWRLEYRALSDLGVEFHPVTQVVGSVVGGLTVRRGYAASTQTLPSIDTLVWIDAPVPNDVLSTPLRESGRTVLTLGDAYAPRTIEQAILDARLALIDR